MCLCTSCLLLFIIIEWTNSLIKFLREQLAKLVEFYNQPYSNMSMQRLPLETETALKQWEYGIRLSGWLLEVSLLCHFVSHIKRLFLCHYLLFISLKARLKVLAGYLVFHNLHHKYLGNHFHINC